MNIESLVSLAINGDVLFVNFRCSCSHEFSKSLAETHDDLVFFILDASGNEGVGDVRSGRGFTEIPELFLGFMDVSIHFRHLLIFFFHVNIYAILNDFPK